MSRELGKLKDSFETGLFWELYTDLERHFQNILEYIPYLPGNEDAYSPKLLNLILAIGGYVDSAFKEIARYKEFCENSVCKRITELSRERKPVGIKLALDAFKDYQLPQKKVYFKSPMGASEIVPFKPEKQDSRPEWWTSYNELKHDASLNIQKANTKNALCGLAGAFLLNVVHIPSAKYLFGRNVVTLTWWETKASKSRVEEYLRRGKIVRALEKGNAGEQPLMARTSLFIYDYRQLRFGSRIRAQLEGLML